MNTNKECNTAIKLNQRSLTSKAPWCHETIGERRISWRDCLKHTHTDSHMKASNDKEQTQDGHSLALNVQYQIT